MILKINPFDTIFFRNAKPFDIGSTFPEGIFPPFPNTVYGALRSAIIANSNKDGIDGYSRFKEGKLKERIGVFPNNGKDTERGNFGIKNIMLSKSSSIKEKLYFPLPNDCVVKKDDDDEAKVISEKLKRNFNAIYSESERKSNIEYYPLNDKYKTPINKWISETFLANYLKGDSEIDIKSIEYFITNENKTGIAINLETGTTEESKIYNIAMNRLKNDVSLLVDIEGIDFSDTQKFLKIGHDGKPAFFHILDEVTYLENTIEDIKKSITDENPFFKLYFSTPLLMEECLSNIENQLEKKIEIISVFHSRAIPVGGWDMANQQPKPIHKAIPSGAVFYIKIKDTITAKLKEELFNIFWNKNLKDKNEEYKFYHQEGFNHCYIGKLEINKMEDTNV